MKKNVGLFFRSDLPALQVRGFAKTIIGMGLQVKLRPVNYRFSANKKKSSKFSFAISLGGDGTYLRTFHELDDTKIPLLGFHLGRLGFLTPFQADRFEEVIKAYQKNKLARYPRSILSLCYFREGQKINQHRAINDVVLERGVQTRLITTRVSMGSRLVNDIRADGLIVSTALGSTAYNLAAGGPILHSEVKGMILCAISPHSIANRPLVLPEHKEIRLSLVGDAKNKKLGRLVVDGMIVDEIRAGDEVRLQMGLEQHWVYFWKDHDEFALMREKIRFGDNWVLPAHSPAEGKSGEI